MRFRSLILLSAICAATAATEVVGLDVADLVADGVQERALGRFELLTWGKKEDFPAVAELLPYADGQGHGRMSLREVTGGLHFHNEGRSKHDPMYDRAGLLAFTPAAPGRYALAGRIVGHSGAKVAEDADTVTWAVVVFGPDPERFRVIQHETRGRHERRFELSDYPALQDIALAPGERLGLTIWRHTWQWYGGGRLDDLRIAPAAEAPWETGTPPSDEELGAADGLPFEADFTAGAQMAVKVGLPGYSPSAVDDAEVDGRRVLDVAIRGVNWSTWHLPDLRLEPGAHYRLRVTGRCRGQVEILEGTLPEIGGFAWQPVAGAHTWEAQFSPREPVVLGELRWRFRGAGSWLIERIAIERIAGFSVAEAPARDRGELLVNSGFALGATGWLHGWNSIDTQRHPERFGDYAVDAQGPVWRVPPGADAVTVFATTPLHLAYGKRYTPAVDASAPVTLRLRRGKDTVATWRFPSAAGEEPDGFVLTPPDRGVFLPAAEPLFHLEAMVVAPNAVRRISFAEAAQTPAVPAETGVSLRSRGDRFDHRVTAGEPVPLRVRAAGLAGGGVGELLVSDHRDAVVHRVPATLDDLPEGGVGLELELAGLPAGWYQLRFAAAEDARAARTPLLVVPRGDLAARNRHLGARQTGAFGKETVAGEERWRNWIPAAKLEASRAIGLSKVKVFNGWEHCEPVSGEWTFGREDNIELLLAHDMEVVLVLGSAPGWARREGGDTPRDLARWEHAVRRMAERWRGRIRHYVTWNEPDLHRVPVEVHLELCAIAHRVLKEVDPANVVIAGATTTSGRHYLLESIDRGLLDHCDVIGFHGYVREQSAHYGPASFREFVDPVLEAMRSRGRELPIWDLEAGFAHNVPEGLPGRALSEVYLKGLVTRQVAGVTRYYSWGTADVGWPGGGHFSMFFGQNKEPMITQALTAAYVAMIGDARFVAVLGEDDAGDHLYHFRTAAGEDVLVGWTSRERASAQAQSVLTTGTVLDHMGRPVASVEDGTVPLTAELRYVVAPDSALPTAFVAQEE